MDTPTSRLGDLAWNFTHVTFDPRRLLQKAGRGQAEGEEPYFVDYIPPSRDAIVLPRYVIYILVAVVLVVVAMYAIVGHLIKDLMHDLAGNRGNPKVVGGRRCPGCLIRRRIVSVLHVASLCWIRSPVLHLVSLVVTGRLDPRPQTRGVRL